MSMPGTAPARRCPASRASCRIRRFRAPRSSTRPPLGDITGDGRPDIVSPTAEFDDNPSAPATPGGGAAGGFSNFLTNVLANVLGGSGRVYALDHNGSVLPGWPTKPNGIVPDALPLVGPGVDHVLGNIDSDPRARGDRQRRVG